MCAKLSRGVLYFCWWARAASSIEWICCRERVLLCSFFLCVFSVGSVKVKSVRKYLASSSVAAALSIVNRQEEAPRKIVAHLTIWAEKFYLVGSLGVASLHADAGSVLASLDV